MLRQNRSCGACVAAKQKSGFGVFAGRNGSPMGARQGRKNNHKNKRGYSAEGYSLLTSALRPRLFGIGIAVSIAAIIGVTLNASDNQASAVSATLSVPEGISVNANPTANNGFAESNNGAISVSTGNQMGYTLTIKAKDNNQLKNGSSVLNSISTNLTADQYKNGDYINTWGFKPSAINSESNTSYVPGPNSTTGITLASTHASSNDAENYSIGIAAKVDSNTVAGNYTNTFVMTATANEATYNITFNTNGGSGGPGSPQHGDIGSSTYVNIASGTPSYSGKDFLGWCSVNPGTRSTCNGVLVQPGGQFPLCKCDLNITLYAMYGKKPADETTMAGFKCGNLQPNATTSLSYAGKSYQVKKVGGYCWMWQDLPQNYNWDNAKTACSNIGGNWALPTQQQFKTLLNNVGRGAELYNEGWQNSTGFYWSSTPRDSSREYVLQVYSSGASIGDDYHSSAAPSVIYGVRCVSQ